MREGRAASGAERMSETAQEQVDRLARFILREVEGEPSESQGAVDTAIRIIREHYPQLSPVRPSVRPAEPQAEPSK